MTTTARTPEREALIEHALPLDDQATCPKCQTAFQPRRKNQTYCSRQCQQNATRGSRAANVSRGQQADNARDWHLLGYLNERYYGTKPTERLGLLKDWLDAARVGDARVARVLSKPAFRVSFKDDRRIYHRRCWAYPPVPLLADQFCIKLRECRVWEWVNGSAPEPETGEVLVVGNPPPAYEVQPLSSYQSTAPTTATLTRSQQTTASPAS